MIKSSFMDNQIVGADDLNELVTLFMSPGLADDFINRDDVSKFEDGTPYNLSVLNGVVYSNLSSGFVPSSNSALMVTVANGVAFIEPGKVIFPHGQVAEIANNDGVNKESVPILSGQDCYIVLHCNEEENRVVLKAMQNLPGLNDNMVVLAKVAANGTTVTDMRKYAKGKAPSMYASDTGLAGMRHFTVTQDMKEITFNSNGAAYNYMVVFTKVKNQSWFTSLSLIDLKTMNTMSGANNGPGSRSYQWFRHYTNGEFTFSYTNSTGLYRNYTIDGTLTVSDGTYTIALKNNVYEPDVESENTYTFPIKATVVLF